VKRGRIFVNKEHQLDWMLNGDASKMNALQPLEAKIKGGTVSGTAAAESGRLKEAGELEAQRSREIAQHFREQRRVAGERNE
jgi:hypothetical protein